MASVFTTLNDLMEKLDTSDSDAPHGHWEVVVQEKTTRSPIEYDLVGVVFDKEEHRVVVQIELRED